MKRAFLAAGIVIPTVLIIVCFMTLMKQPSNDRGWSPAQANVPTAENISTSTATIHNVRDWTYDTRNPISTDWTTATVDPNKIKRVWFIVEPFSAIKVIGHTFLSFEFEDGTTLDFSVEARREEVETYSAWKGLFNEYELNYQWGTERDFVARRLVYLNHPLRMYPLTLSHDSSVALFRSLLEETNKLAEKPRFYNTLTANCTNVLAHIVNAHYPGTLPYDIAWNLTGLADKYLMREKLIETNGKPPDEMRAAYDLTPFRAGVAAHATSSPTEFSAYIRTLIPQ